MTDLDHLKNNIRTECADDHVGLWSVIREVEHAFPGQSETEIREQTLRLLHELLIAHEIEAGFPTTDGRGFRSLGLSPEGVLQRIRNDWKVGRPTIGESIWFTKAR